jgi:hypothetical protein
MRNDLRGKGIYGVDISKLVSTSWRNLAPLEKEPYETQAKIQKDKYDTELQRYKKTSFYRDYKRCFDDFGPDFGASWGTLTNL